MSKCRVFITRKSKSLYWTLFWPKYWAWTGAARNIRKTTAAATLAYQLGEGRDGEGMGSPRTPGAGAGGRRSTVVISVSRRRAARGAARRLCRIDGVTPATRRTGTR